MKKIYIYWWRVFPQSGHPFIKTTHTTRKMSSRTLQQYDRTNGWKVGTMHWTTGYVEEV